MKIEQVIGREIYDSQGYPTIECELVLEQNLHVIASVPAGKSKSSYEATELRDEKRLMGHGVNKAIESLESNIAPIIVGKEPNMVELDLAMIQADGTDDKSVFGANTMLAASIAICRAQAVVDAISIYDLIAYLCNYNAFSIPYPMFNMISGGVHTDSSCPIQEFLLIPVGEQTFRSAFESSILTFHAIKDILQKKNKKIELSREGGFIVDISCEEEAFDILSQGIAKSKGKFLFAIDVAADQLYNKKTKKYRWFKKTLTRDQLIDHYVDLTNQYPLCSIEDGLSSADWEGWNILLNTLGETIQIAGDDLFATDVRRVALGVEDQLANAVVIKPNQIGTVTEALQTVKFAKENELSVIVANRSSETNDTFMVDLAVGVSANYIKAGGCSRGERLAKYNQLLRIEDSLQRSLLEE